MIICHVGVWSYVYKSYVTQDPKSSHIWGEIFLLYVKSVSFLYYFSLFFTEYKTWLENGIFAFFFFK